MAGARRGRASNLRSRANAPASHGRPARPPDLVPTLFSPPRYAWEHEQPTRWGRGFAVITNTGGQGHATQLKIPIGSVAKWAVERFFTPGSPVSEIYLDNLQAEGVRAIEIEKDGGDGRITFYRADGGNHGLNVGSTLSLWRA